MSTAELTETQPDRRREFLDGMRYGLPVLLASMPFGLLFGALAAQNGMSVGEAVLMSATVFAGASQMVGLELFGQTIAPWLIVLSIFAVNFRHVLYSAALGRRVTHWTPFQRAFGFFFLTDPQYAEGEKKALNGGLSFAWFMGMATPIYIFWVVEAGIGAAFGNLVPNPHALGFDFLLPIYFLGLVMDFRKRPLWLPVVAISAAVSIAAFYLVGSPWHVSIGAAAGIALAAALTPAKRGASL
ncbi:AzlC family ABC transporter permease [Mesorhizobium microcysteis]|uniref:AzlC family ABC transporter permease n=1 Tax=Neoaquamicrobium microcysteis TaxID=2682781 RepID=A0A5D4GWZ4_9HYPH|nr:AzlC family ABC transporter permease [Mesorhizobium microcysteis]TYR32389.1 AzlC family ABC transporter permease [Mesorhizobium microcysteis]